jgi:hypothetical protein
MLVATQIQDIKLQFSMAHRPASSGSRMRRRTSLQVAQNRDEDSRSVGLKTQLFELSDFIAVCGIATAVLLQVPLTKRNFMHALIEEGIISADIAADFAPARVAVVGGGIAGLTAAWQLSQTGRHAVTVFEARDYLGGNCHRICWNHTYPGMEPVCFTESVAMAGDQYYNMVEMLKELEVPMAWSTLPWDPQRRGMFDCTSEKMAMGGCTQVPLPGDEEINRFRNLMTQEHEFTANVTLGQLLEKHKFSKELRMLISISGGLFDGNGIELPANVYRTFVLNQATFAVQVMQWGSQVGERSAAGNGESNRPRRTDEHIHKMVQQMRQRGVEFALN